MKKLKKYRRLFKVVLPLLFLLALLQEPVWAQYGPLLLPANPGEHIVLDCDRSIYGVNEKIYFSATYRGPGDSEGPVWSSIMYVELLQWDGLKQAMLKVLIENNRAEGEIEVPGNIPSGVYYLRAYTKWLRNYGPGSYTYIPLKILNPYSQELLAPPPNSDTLPPMECAQDEKIDGVVFSGLKEVYDSREPAEFEIQLPENLLSGTYSLNIAKTESISSLDYGFNEKIKAEEESGTVDFLPEIRGLSLSGRIIEKESGLPVADKRLQLSTYTDPLLFSELSSGKDGSFLFTLPHFSAKPEFHLAEAADSMQAHLIHLVPEFCNKAILLPYVPLSIDTSEQEAVRELLVNIQLKERFGLISDQEEAMAIESKAFYGSETTVTNVRDYIELSDLRECIDEIIPQVSIRSSSRGEHLTIVGPSCLDIYPPLILIDNVPVPNNEELLHIPSSRIKSIEVLNEAYVIGESRYSGILNIFSNQNDMAGISLDGEHSFFDLQLLNKRLSTMEYQAGTGESVQPDIRNQLYWDSEIEFSEKGTFKAAFSTSDASGLYVVTLRGMNPGNSITVCKKALFSVK